MTKSLHASDLSSSYSIDSLEILDSKPDYCSRPSKIPLYRGQKSNMSPAKKINPNRKIQRKSIAPPATNRSAPVVTTTSDVVYPEIIVKHYHNDKLYEKVVPAVEGKKKRAKGFVEIYQHGDAKGRLHIQPFAKNKSYLEIFQARNGYKVVEKVSDKSTVGDESPRTFEDGDCPDDDDLNDTSSFYLNLINNVKNNIQYNSQVSSERSFSQNSERFSKNSSLVATAMTGLESISEQRLSTPESAPKLPVQRPRLIRVTKPDPTKLKMDRFLKQREYGQSASNMNRFKMQRSKTKSVTVQRGDCCAERSVENDVNVTKKVVEEKLCPEQNLKPTEEKFKVQSNNNRTKMVAKPIQEIGKDLKESKNILLRNQIDTPKMVRTMFEGKRRQPAIIPTRSNIKTLQERHIKEKLLVDKLRVS